jgi:tRNA 2-thiouridine synthesizing protein A
MTNSKVDHLLDLRGKVCPYPTLDTRLTLDKMAVGEILEVILDYYPARQTIPNLMCDLGYPCAFHEENQHEFRITIHKIQ